MGPTCYGWSKSCVTVYSISSRPAIRARRRSAGSRLSRINWRASNVLRLRVRDRPRTHAACASCVASMSLVSCTIGKPRHCCSVKSMSRSTGRNLAISASRRPLGVPRRAGPVGTAATDPSISTWKRSMSAWPSGHTGSRSREFEAERHGPAGIRARRPCGPFLSIWTKKKHGRASKAGSRGRCVIGTFWCIAMGLSHCAACV